MYLFPDQETMKQLSKSLNPHVQLMEYAFNSIYPHEGTMAEFFLESCDVDDYEVDCYESNPFLDGWENTGIMHGAQLTNWDEI